MIPAEAPDPTLTDARLAALADRLQRNIGVIFAAPRYRQLRRALAAAAAELREPTAAACLEYLLRTPFDRALLGRLAPHVTVGETYFLREPATLATLCREVLPALAAERGTGLRLWSAGCASGEEAYSLAMLAEEARLGAVDILGTDINERALQAARIGRYGPWSFRGVPAAQQARFIRHTDTGAREVGEPLRRQVRFAYLNLAEDSYPSAPSGIGQMDLILCRNVLMYFEPGQARRALARLAASLRDGGWLAVAAAEGAIVQACAGSVGLAVVPFDGVTLYHKPALRAAAAPSRRQPERTAAARRVAAAPISAPAAASTPATPAAAAAQARARLAEAPTDIQALLRLAEAAADRGALDAAARWCARAIAADRLQPAAHYLDACILAEQEAPAAALAALDRALFLAPDFARAHLMRAALARRHSSKARTLASLDAALAILGRRPEDSGDGPAGDEAALADMARLMRQLTLNPPGPR